MGGRNHTFCSGGKDAAQLVAVVDQTAPGPGSEPELIGFVPSHQDTRPGEGLQVVELTASRFSGDVLVVNNEQCGKNGKGGVSLFDVTDPLNPKKLSENFGDREPGSRDSNEIHSAFAWDAGGNAYVVVTDNREATDVDIFDITNRTGHA